MQFALIEALWQAFWRNLTPDQAHKYLDIITLDDIRKVDVYRFLFYPPHVFSGMWILMRVFAISALIPPNVVFLVKICTQFVDWNVHRRM